MPHPGRLLDRRDFLRAAATGAALAAAGCKTIPEPPGPDCDPPSVSGVDWIPDVAHPVAFGEEHLTTADGAPRIMSIYYPSPRFLPPRPMLRSCLGRWPVVLLLHGQPPGGVSTSPADAYNRRFSRIAVALARSGYVVVAPLHTPRPTPENTSTLIAEAQTDVDWVRNTWHEAKWVDRSSRSVTVVGHSFGGIEAARIAAGWPEVAALVSLSGTYLELNDVADLISSISCPSLFMFSKTPGVEFELIEDNPNPVNNFWRTLPGDRYAAIFEGQHFDYLDASASGTAPRGPCTQIGQLAADLTALFVASSVRSLTRVPIELRKPQVVLTDAQQALAIQHLPAIDKDWGEVCKVQLKWRAGGQEGTRTIG
jgi:pimeloyl-ACP methyl ester carboxylesterase